jgi:hypothetical protein
MASSKPGLGSENMDEGVKEDIHRMGGEASAKTRRGGSNRKGVITNKAGGGRLTKADQRKGGHARSRS